MKRHGFCDLHVHTHRSDALSRWSPEAVILKAKEMGIVHLGLSDHNILNLQQERQTKKYGIDVISSVEFSSEAVIGGKQFEIHIVGFRVNPAHIAVQRIARAHRQSRDGYINAMLKGLEEEGIHITMEELKERNPHSSHIGRVAIGERIIEMGYAKNMREVYGNYLGSESGSRAYQPSQKYLRYRKLEDVVSGILQAGGLPILAHLPYYEMTELEQMELLKRFCGCAGGLGAMETEYGNYPPKLVEEQKYLAKTFRLMESTGSDFHGYEGTDLKQGDPLIYERLQNCWEGVFGG